MLYLCICVLLVFVYLQVRNLERFFRSSYHYPFKNIAHVMSIWNFDQYCTCVFLYLCICKSDTQEHCFWGHCIITFQKISGLYGLKRHIVKIRGGVTRRDDDERQWKIGLLSLWAVGRLSFARGTGISVRCEEKWNISATDERKSNPIFASEAFLESEGMWRKKTALPYVFAQS